jgi:TRAP-type C4-dicarboxylate transport system permease large subunit
MALPLFIMMGEFLVRIKVSDDLFEGLTPWVAKLPDGLLHVNVIASAFFAAITGSVNATTTTVGKSPSRNSANAAMMKAFPSGASRAPALSVF